MKKLFKNIINIPKYLSISLLGLYQISVSPDHSWLSAKFPHGCCRYYPSCSEYSKQAIEKFGTIKGFWLSAKRLLKCHPWAEPTIDLIPNS